MLRRILVNPFASLLLAGLLFADLRSLPTNRWDSGHSQLAIFFKTGRFARDYLAYPSERRSANFMVKDSAVVQISPEQRAQDARNINIRPQSVLTLVLLEQTSRQGLWAPTRETQTCSIEALRSSELTSEQRDQARTSLADQAALIDTDIPPAAFEELRRSGRYAHTTIVWSGYLHNTLTLLCLILLLNSLRWIPRSPAYFRARRAARGLCSHCGYSLAGLTTTTCPECGADVPPKEPS